MLLTPEAVAVLALRMIKANTGCKSKDQVAQDFKDHFGSSPLDIAEIWYDMCHTDIAPAKVPKNEQNERGFHGFMRAVYFLWVYPRSSKVMANSCSVGERQCRGHPLRLWVKRIAALKEKKIVWDPDIDHPGKEKFVMTVDGTDFKIHEKKHPTLPIDRKLCSHKFNHGALKYEIGFSVFKCKCVWINGPFKGGTHDMVIFRDKLLKKIPEGKLVIADGGYSSQVPSERARLSLPNTVDSPALKNFKSRARSRHESFNGRIAKFGCLNDTFKQSIGFHKDAFTAVCVMVQYQMDNGAELFSV